jgi:transposase
VLGTIQETGERLGAVTRVAGQLGIATESLRCWVVKGRYRRRPPGVTTKERRRIAELEREHRQLRRANELLKDGSPNTGAVGWPYPHAVGRPPAKRRSTLLGRVLGGGRGPPFPLGAHGVLRTGRVPL